MHIHRDKCEDKRGEERRIVPSGQLYLHHFLLVSRVALRYGNMAPGSPVMLTITTEQSLDRLELLHYSPLDHSELLNISINVFSKSGVC